MRSTTIERWGTKFIVKENGEWYNFHTGRWGAFHIPKDGSYPSIIVNTPEGRKGIRLHRFLALAFKPNSNAEVLHVRHLDGDVSNWKLSNLEWGTPLQNIQDKDRHGTQQRGSQNYNALLTEDLVLEIRQRVFDPGYRVLGITPYMRMVSDMLDLSEGGLREMLTGDTWKHIKVLGLPDKFKYRTPIPPSSEGCMSEEDREFLQSLRCKKGLRKLGNWQFCLFIRDRFPKRFSRYSEWKIRSAIKGLTLIDV